MKRLYLLSMVMVPLLQITPANIYQGEPVMVTVQGTTSVPVKSVPPLLFFMYQGRPTALYGNDINKTPGTTTVVATFRDGSRASGSYLVLPRLRPQESMPVPVAIGGNSPANQTRILSILAKENAELAAVYSRKDKALWTSAFAYPVADPFVTDPYGYDRDSGLSVITHKGSDFRAATGTPIHAVNRGVVRVAKTFVMYGNTAIVYHDLGLLSMYMHLSKLAVVPGQLVEKGQLVGLSGMTGYAEGPHLHLTVRVGGISIDPMKFFALFGVR
ncbi:MAG: M23 family metallopeptidase [Candidatus Paceibacterota bacterium]